MLKVPLAATVLVAIGDPEQFDDVNSRTRAPGSAVPKKVGARLLDGEGGDVAIILGDTGGILSVLRNTAPTLLAAFMVTTQELVPMQAPDHPTN